MKARRSFGTHNLHDAAGVPTFFADVILFTEAVPRTIRAKARAARARLRARTLGGYTIRVCKSQRDLVVALRRRHYKVTGTRYELVHGGRAGVTPHRGTYVVETIERATGRRVAFICEHRINAAFPPYVRGEALFREVRWRDHTITTGAMIADYRLRGWSIRAGGDDNTPARVKAYPMLPGEYGTGYDRLASTDPIVNGERLTRKQSDHPRLRAWS